MTRWRVVRAPASRHGPRYAVLSDREPGPVMGARGGLHGWSDDMKCKQCGRTGKVSWVFESGVATWLCSACFYTGRDPSVLVLPAWLTFEAACQIAADGNGKPSTANMDDRSGAT